MYKGTGVDLEVGMARAELALPSKNQDFWPGQSLASWELEPKDAFANWMAQLRVLESHQFRESSRETYTSMFNVWLSSLAARGVSLLEATPMDAQAFFGAAKLEPVSRRRYLQLLDRVYAHLRIIGWHEENPVMPLLRSEPELAVELPPGLPDDLLQKLIADLASKGGWKGDRDRTIAALLIGAGLRVNELIHLPVLGVTDNFTIHVNPRGVHREHTTLILPEGPWREWYLAWGPLRRQWDVPGDYLCPVSLDGEAFSPSGLFRRVRSWLKPISQELPQFGPNILRNTFARIALSCGRYKISQVQEFLGHEEVRATVRHQAAHYGGGALARDSGPPS